jgi:thiosulfate dehydrogenase [quinone] large subunit
MNQVSDRQVAYALARIGLGINIAMHGLARIPRFEGFAAHLHDQFADTFLPTWFVQLTASGIVTTETIVGLLIVFGLWLRPALVAGGVLMWVLLFGACLVQNWGVAGSQLVYVAFFAGLLAWRNHDWLSLDARRARRT